MVLVYGDTNSTIAGALAAKKKHVLVGHVEAGLRSFDIKMPEEVNRILTDRISDMLFCPTQTAVDNLKNEGFNNFGCDIIKSGDVMQDAAYYYAKKSALKSNVIEKNNLKEFILCTLHRAENTDDSERLNNIISALNTINNDIEILLPLHPRTKKIIEKNKMELNVNIIEPVGYFDMIELLKHCKLVMTDSGGLQKEAYFFKKNCVTMRDQTEWLELLENGTNVIAGADKDKILECVNKMLHRTSDFVIDLYGNGKASANISHELLKYVE